MATTFLKDSDDRQVYGRAYARGLKTFELGEGVASGVDVDFDIQGDKLVAVKSADASNVGTIAFVGKKFGLVGKEIGMVSKLDIILLGEGLMLVTLVSGALVLDLDGTLSPVAVGNVPSNLVLSEKTIDWVTRDHIMQYINHFDAQKEYPFEYEFVFEFSGHADYGRSIKHLAGEDADISMGYVAAHQAELEARKRSHQLESMFAMMSASSRSTFDHDGDEEDEDEDAAYYAMLADGEDEEYLGTQSKPRQSKKSNTTDDDEDDYYL